jgi:hypothetical protein
MTAVATCRPFAAPARRITRDERRMSRPLIWILWMTLAAVWFGTLGQRALTRPDEGRYAEIPREMAVSGDWLTPRLNDIKYFEKPALQYWATAAGFKVFADNEWTARLWPALTGFFSIAAGLVDRAPALGGAGGPSGGRHPGEFAAVRGHGPYSDPGHGAIVLSAGGVDGLSFAQKEDRLRQSALDAAGLGRAGAGGAVQRYRRLVLTGATLLGYTLLNRDTSPWRRLSPWPVWPCS